jgi:nucleoid-associated protein YgaU
MGEHMTSKYQMWLTYNGGTEKIRFPVLPARINVKKANSSKSVSIQGLGEVIIKGDPSAVEISFSSFFPALPFLGVEVETSPSELEEKITACQNSEKPVQFLITGTNINMFFSIESFNVHEDGGDVGTLHYTLNLKEYKEVSARRVNVSGGRAALPSRVFIRTDNRLPQRLYTVVKGDSLWSISMRNFGTEKRLSEIFNLNREKITDPNLIREGLVLRLMP